jgi:hypothetical protein
MRLLAALVVLLAAAPAQARKPVRIAQPVAGAVVPAYPHLRSVAAQIDLRGRAARNTTLLLRARCALGPCTTTVVVGRKGRWKANLHVIVAPEQRRLGIRVAYADLGTQDSGLVVAELGLPAWAQQRAAPPGEELAMIGDSLAVGTDEPLRRQLDGWSVTTDARTSRPLATGMAVLAATPIPRAPVVLAFSLFTNDDPRGIEGLDAAVRRSVAVLRPGGCAIWATIVRPKVAGMSYKAVNARLHALALELGPALRIVDWNDAVKQHRNWVRDDGVHATPEGYEARAALYAQTARDCRSGA